MDTGAIDIGLARDQAMYQTPNTSQLTNAGNRDAIRKAAEQFEATFLSQMFGRMFDGIKSDGMFKGGNAEDIFNGLLVQEYGKTVAGKGGIGLADAIERQLLALQEA
jgi:flagellar protein FlgJ